MKHETTRPIVTITIRATRRVRRRLMWKQCRLCKIMFKGQFCPNCELWKVSQLRNI